MTMAKRSCESKGRLGFKKGTTVNNNNTPNLLGHISLNGRNTHGKASCPFGVLQEERRGLLTLMSTSGFSTLSAITSHKNSATPQHTSTIAACLLAFKASQFTS